MNCYPKTLLFRAENLSIKRQCPFSHFSLNLAKVSELLRVELVILNCLSTLNLGGIVQRFKKKWCFVLMVSKREDNLAKLQEQTKQTKKNFMQEREAGSREKKLHEQHRIEAGFAITQLKS